MAYDPVGALNGLFAPAYIAGNQESDQAVQNWMVAHPRSPGVATFVPNATAAATPVAQPAAQPAAQPLAPAADAQRNNIAAAIQTPPAVNPEQAAYFASPTGQYYLWEQQQLAQRQQQQPQQDWFAPFNYQPWVNAS